MKKIQYILYLGLVLLITFTSCRDEFFSYDDTKVVEGLPASIILGFKSQENTVVTRAERDPKYENRVDNIYIFIFDSQGNVHYRKFFNTGDITFPTESHDKGTLQLNTQSLNHAKIVGIANVSVEGVTATAYTITEADLNNITSLNELENMVMTMDENSVERYAIFMMTGVAEDSYGKTDITIPGTESGTKQLNCSIKLRRTDAKIKFVVTTDNVHGYTDFSFSPRNWTVKRVPSQSYILPKSEGDYDEKDAKYFTSLEMPFEVITRDQTNPKLDAGGSFVFYMPENRKSPKTEITREGNETNEQLYALREKWNGNDDEGDKVFTNANDNSTYVEMTGLLSYNDPNNDNKNTNADIKLIVHLGNPKEKDDGSYDVNNYNTNRNTFYTYNIIIRGVEDIKVEVSEQGEEPRPGYEGDVVDTENKAFVFDSHYDRCLIKIKPSDIPQEGEIYWSINTPFSRGVHTVTNAEVEENLRDYRWIKFAVNAEYGVPEGQYVKYPGDQNYNDPYPFEGQSNNQPSPYYSEGGLGYSYGYSEILGRPYDSSKARLLDINQLMVYLRELGKTEKDWGEEGITITTFVDENLYFKHPITGEETGRSLWKLTSDKEDRILYLVITKPEYSLDGNSSVVVAEYSFRQRTIRTIYNVDHPDLQTAWGLESVMETKRLPSGEGYNNKANDTRNGRNNCLRWLVGKKWTEVVNTSGDGYVLKEPYNNAAFACMLRNRDLNGDNTIDDREVRWYLASIDQLTDIFLGEYALDEQSRLYPSNAADREGMVRWHYTSSSYNVSDKKPWVLWAEEGASKGSYSDSNGQMGGLYNYRCVRNLGIDFVHPEEVPQDLVQVIEETDGYVLIDMSFMNSKARRSSYVTKLPNHNEREDINRTYSKFRVHKDCFATPYKVHDGSPWVGERHTAWVEKDINSHNWEYYQTSDPSPLGYRIPNQREFLIMTSRLNDNQWPNYHLKGTSYKYQAWPPQYVPYEDDLGYYRPNRYICQTAFSLNGDGPYSNGLRQGFIWEFGNKVFYLQNNKDEVGYVRPVQDVR